MAAALGVIDTLAQSRAFTAPELAQAYMESRGYLIGDASANPSTRKIHIVAAWVLLTLHNQDGQKADAGQTEPLLIRYADALNDLKSKLQTQNIAAIIESYRRVQLLAAEVSKRELIIARVTTRMALLRLNPEQNWTVDKNIAVGAGRISSGTEIVPSVNTILGKTMTSKHAANEVWTPAKDAMVTTGSLFVPWNDTIKSDMWNKGIFGGIQLFTPSAQTIQEALDTGASDDEW